MKARVLAVIACALAASGCISLLPEPQPPPRLYVLRAGEPPAEAATMAMRAAPSPVVIAVASPVAPRALAGSDIAWRKDGQLAYVGGAAWAGRATDLLQSMLVDVIDAGGRVRGAVRAGEAKADAEIQWDVLEFEVVEEGGLEARVALRAKLFDARTRTLVDTMKVNETRPVRDRSTGVAARALEEAARAGAAQIGDWAAERALALRQSPSREEPLLGGPQ